MGSREQTARNLAAYDSKADFDRHLIRYNLVLIAPHLSGGTTLEMGCANGLMTEMLASRVQRLVVVDCSSEYLAEVQSRLRDQKNIRYVESFFEEFEPSERFNDILLTRGLEHVEKPVQLLRRAAGWLAQEGKLHIVVPNAFSLHRRLGVAMGLLKDCHDFSERDYWLGHKRVYDLKLLRRHISQAGLKLTTWRGCFLKPLSNAPMEKWDLKILDGLFKLGEEFPESCAELYAQCSRE